MEQKIKTKEEVIWVMKDMIKKNKDMGLHLGEVGSAGWRHHTLSEDEAKHAGYISALSWAYGITPAEVNEKFKGD